MNSGIVLLFSTTAGLASFLLFTIEPMIGKMVLPLFGGAPAVWNTCLLYYQVMLFLGYALSGAFSAAAGVERRRVSIFYLAPLAGLLILGYWVQPVRLSLAEMDPAATTARPVMTLLGLLAASTALPLLVVSATALLVQHWFAETGHPRAHDPYFLYAASNAGSLLALVSYPWVIEPNLGLEVQSGAWKSGFLIEAILLMACGWLARRLSRGVSPRRTSDGFPASTGAPVETTTPTLATRLGWLGLVFVPSSWLMGVTTYLTTDLAAIPLLWVIPLFLYLLSFVIAFSDSLTPVVRLAARCLPFLVMPLALVMIAGFVHAVWIPLHLLTFFTGALACHGRLARQRPPARCLSTFYVSIALGGLLGGAFNALIAPLVFTRVVEYPMALVLACLAAPVRDGRLRQAGSRQWLERLTVGLRTPRGDANTPPKPPLPKGGTIEADRPVIAPALRRKGMGGFCGKELRASATQVLGALADLILAGTVFLLAALLTTNQAGLAESGLGAIGLVIAAGLGCYAGLTAQHRPTRFAMVVAAILLAGGLSRGPSGRLLHVERNFFGVVRVTEDRQHGVRRLFHGSTLHGQQSLDPARRREPSTYFTPSGPIGQLFAVIGPRLERPGTRIAVVGLGVGTLAAYARPVQRWTFYEIDPAIDRIARDPRDFTYLRDCEAAAVDVVLGDARLRLRDAPDHAYQLIVLDAFSSDALPVHLLTREAIGLYRAKVAEGGVLAFNLSTRYVDLEPVIGRQAADAGLVCRVRSDTAISPDERDAGKQPSIWAVMAAKDEDLAALAHDPRWGRPALRPNGRVWTDDYSDLARYLRWLPRRVRTQETKRLSPASIETVYPREVAHALAGVTWTLLAQHHRIRAVCR